jgi:hypothetical protein
MLFNQRLLHVNGNNVRLDLAVVAVGGFAVAPDALDLHVLVERVLGNCHGAGFPLRLIPHAGRIEDFLGKSFRNLTH